MAAPSGVDPAAWAALLRWSMKQQADGDGTRPSEFTELSQEKRDFLEAVMREGVVDLVQKADDLLRQLREGTAPCREGGELAEDAADELSVCAEELLDIVDQIDFAKALVQLGGSATLLDVVRTCPPRLKMQALEIVATVAQNNPFAQQVLLAEGALPAITDAFWGRRASADDAAAADGGDGSGGGGAAVSTKVQTKALLALSCLVRGYAAGETAFCSEDGGGLSILCSAMTDSDDVRLRRKATFLLNALLLSENTESGRLQAMSALFVPVLVRQAEQDTDVDLRESTARALSTLAARGHKDELLTAHGDQLRAVLARCEEQAADVANEDRDNAQKEAELWASLGL